MSTTFPTQSPHQLMPGLMHLEVADKVVVATIAAGPRANGNIAATSRSGDYANARTAISAMPRNCRTAYTTSVVTAIRTTFSAPEIMQLNPGNDGNLMCDLVLLALCLENKPTMQRDAWLRRAGLSALVMLSPDNPEAAGMVLRRMGDVH